MKALYYNAILGILLFFPSFLKAQIRPFEPLNPDRIFFKGKVVDTDNNALPKVSIYIPGSMRGTISDSNGNFYIDAKPKETLYFTYAGKEDAYRLYKAYYVTCTGYDLDENGEVCCVHATYDPETFGGDSPDGRKVKGTIHWVSAKENVLKTMRNYLRA